MDFKIKNKNNDIIEIGLEKQNSYIRLQKINTPPGVNAYCAISTFVDPTQRGKGLGFKLYKELIKFIRSNNAKFSATCPFIVDQANKDKTIKDIYIDR